MERLYNAKNSRGISMNKRKSKIFSIGLPMDASISEFEDFLLEFGELLSSMYFSIPLGRKFYSRTELENEYESPGAEDKLFIFLDLLQKYNIRTELAVNTFKLSNLDLDCIVRYLSAHDIILDEIVCIKEYGSFFRQHFPKVELKYSFNNISYDVPEYFDTVVFGKEYLRDMKARHRWIEEGKGFVLLLNNGCSFSCHFECGDSKFCGAILNKNLESHSLDYLYALQSFFPFELDRLYSEDSYISKYRFKISNRPLGMQFTRNVLRYYADSGDISTLISQSADNYGYFCVMQQLFVHRNELNYNRIMNIKRNLPV